MQLSIETRRRWFARGAAAWHRAQVVLGVPSQDARSDLYACPLCLNIDHDERRARFCVFTEAALHNQSLTVEHVPPQSFGGRPLVLTCRACNNTSGAGVDAHARKRENPRDAFLGRVATKISMTAGTHRLAGSFMLTSGAYHFAVTKRRNAHRPDAEAGVRRTLTNSEDSTRDITLSFDYDRFDDDLARVSWLRTAYLALFSVAGYGAVVGREMELVRRQIREPKVAHIPTFLIDTRSDEDWSARLLLRVTAPQWHRCWAVKVGHLIACLPLAGDVGFYERLGRAARRERSRLVAAQAEAWEFPTSPSFGMPFSRSRPSAPING